MLSRPKSSAYFVFSDEMRRALSDANLTELQMNQVLIRMWNRKHKFQNEWSEEKFNERMEEYNKLHPEYKLMHDTLTNLNLENWDLDECTVRLEANTFSFEHGDTPEHHSSVWVEGGTDVEQFFELFEIKVNDDVSFSFSAIGDNKILLNYEEDGNEIVNIIISCPPQLTNVYNCLVQHTKLNDYPDF